MAVLMHRCVSISTDAHVFVAGLLIQIKSSMTAFAFRVTVYQTALCRPLCDAVITLADVVGACLDCRAGLDCKLVTSFAAGTIRVTVFVTFCALSPRALVTDTLILDAFSIFHVVTNDALCTCFFTVCRTGSSQTWAAILAGTFFNAAEAVKKEVGVVTFGA